MFIDMFKSLSMGSESLYSGLVHLVGSDWTRLTTIRGTGPVNVTLYLLLASQ